MYIARCLSTSNIVIIVECQERSILILPIYERGEKSDRFKFKKETLNF